MVGLRVSEVVRNSMVEVAAMMKMMSEMASDNDDIEVIQDEEPREEKSGAPKGIRDPSV